LRSFQLEPINPLHVARAGSHVAVADGDMATPDGSNPQLGEVTDAQAAAQLSAFRRGDLWQTRPRPSLPMIEELESRLWRISQSLYDTRVSEEQMEEEVIPWLADDIRFTDPWQQGEGLDAYRNGAAAFHAMFNFDFDVFQLNVQLNEHARTGRGIVDGVMNLRQVGWLFTYQLRTILVYDFTLLEEPRGDVRFLIQHHEHMWSLGDMIEAVPGLGWIYGKVFRRACSTGFLAAGALVRRLRREPKMTISP
jgi:hypothetical protein